MEKRYEKNMPALSRKECSALADKRVCVVGCGGIGGYVIEQLARIGVGYITVIDHDTFCESNLNRQLFSTENNLGTSKVLAAHQRINKINSTVEFNAIKASLNEHTAEKFLQKHDVAVDALDDISERFVLAEYCQKLGLPLVHGAIGGWYGQVSTILPGDNTLSLIYQNTSTKEAEPEAGSLTFSAAMTASAQCGEVIKLLTGKGKLLVKQLLRLDLLDNDYSIIDLT